jgi:hypothetical protein
MKFFKNKYRARIEDKIIDTIMQRAYLQTEKEKVGNLNTKEIVHHIILIDECEKRIELLRSLL